MARRRGMEKFRRPTAPPEEPAQQADKGVPERHVMFGTPRDRNRIIVCALVTAALVGVVFFALFREEKPFPWVAMIFMVVHGGLLGMLFAQLALVYPDHVIVIMTVLFAVMFDAIYIFATGQFEEFHFSRKLFQAMVALFFWGGFMGFWAGFIAFAKRRAAHQRFRQRFQPSADDSEFPQ